MTRQTPTEDAKSRSTLARLVGQLDERRNCLRRVRVRRHDPGDCRYAAWAKLATDGTDPDGPRPAA